MANHLGSLLQEPARPSSNIDHDLLRKFDQEIWSKTPHFSEPNQIVNPTPLVDITQALAECGKSEYGLTLSPKTRVYAKFDSQIFGGSVKVRPAIEIIRAAIINGELKHGQRIFEATSGNFGLALGLLKRLGLEVIVLVSRKLQTGVLDELNNEGVRSVNLDVDICPAPGLKIDQNLAVAKVAATNLRGQLVQLGLDSNIFDQAKNEIVSVLAKQDIINLAKLLAKIYNGFCPEQYDNELNVRSHETVTAQEIDRQLQSEGYRLDQFNVITAFGTGGTSTGLARYGQAKYAKKNVHVVFPLSNQDVAGIRTRDKAAGLRFYQPDLYAGEHEVDFEAAGKLSRYFAGRGYGIGESGALALYSCLQMINYGAGTSYVVMIADGLQKYMTNLQPPSQVEDSLEVDVDQASMDPSRFGQVLWTHPMFAPKDEGVELLAASLKIDKSKVKIATARDVQELISRDAVPEGIKALLSNNKSKTLLVCMVGGTSLRAAEIMAKNGIGAQSLTGGIIGLGQSNNKGPDDLVEVARE